MAAPKNNELTLEVSFIPEFHENLYYIKDLDCFYIFTDEKYYRPLDVFTFKKRIADYLLIAYKNKVSVTSSLLEDLYKQLAFVVPYKDTIADDHYISFDDCLLDLDTFTTLPHSKDIIVTLHFPFTYEEVRNARAPLFDGFVKSTLVLEEDTTVHDPELAVVMQEMIGNLLLPEMHAASCFFLVGDGANGKSTWTNMIIAMFGGPYVSSYSIETLTTRPFALAGLVGKKANICNEEESRFMKQSTFKALISGDTVAAERKFGAAFEFAPTVKFLFCSNNLPSFDGVDPGLRRRIKIVPFFRFFEENERDPYLTKKLIAEMPGIIRWALIGANRLKANNYIFSESAAVKAMAIEFENEMSTSLLYLREHWECSIDRDDFVSNDDLYSHYRSWCERNGRKPVGAQKFHNDIGRMTKVRPAKNNGKRGKLLRPVGDFDIMAPGSSQAFPL